MKTWWYSQGIQIKLQIIIQLVLIAVLIPTQLWIERHFKEEILLAAERRARVSADGVINGMNMLMINGMIKDAENRALYIRKMGSSCDWSREAYTLDEHRNAAVKNNHDFLQFFGI